jgi:hypothetical protein
MRKLKIKEEMEKQRKNRKKETKIGKGRDNVQGQAPGTITHLKTVVAEVLEGNTMAAAPIHSSSTSAARRASRGACGSHRSVSV